MKSSTNRPLRVFLSHASEDKSAVRALHSLLKEKNIEVWLDEEKILPGQNWESEIRKGLEDADVVIVCLSKNLAGKEGYIQRELRMAIRKAEEKPENTIYLIPLRLEDCEAPSSFEHLQWADMFFNNGTFDKFSLERVLLSLRKRAESLGLLWTSLFPNQEQPSSPSVPLRPAEKHEPARTIEIESHKKTRNTSEKSDWSVSGLKIESSVNISRTEAAKPIVDAHASLIVYVIDVSATMAKPLWGKTRLGYVQTVLETTIQEMYRRSLQKDNQTSAYKLAVYAYSDDVVDILMGVQPIDTVARHGLPKFGFKSRTDTARAFIAVENLLRQEFHHANASSVPLICHITDGKFTGDNPVPIAQRILEMSLGQGNVVIENYLICDDLLMEPIEDIMNWKGITQKSDIRNEYALSLFDMSSTIPQSYHQEVVKHGYKLSAEAKLLFPGECAGEFIKLLLP